MLSVLCLSITLLSHPIETPVAGFANVPDNVNWAQAEVIHEANDNSVIDNYIRDYCLFYDTVDPDLVKAVIGGESSGNIRAFNVNRNGTKDYGLMQINTCNHAWLEDELGITDWYDPEQNIHAGVYILYGLTQKYSDLHQILMSYNMGEDKMKELWRKGVRSSEYSIGIVQTFNKLKEGRR